MNIGPYTPADHDRALEVWLGAACIGYPFSSESELAPGAPDFYHCRSFFAVGHTLLDGQNWPYEAIQIECAA